MKIVSIESKCAKGKMCVESILYTDKVFFTIFVVNAIIKCLSIFASDFYGF